MNANLKRLTPYAVSLLAVLSVPLVAALDAGQRAGSDASSEVSGLYDRQLQEKDLEWSGTPLETHEDVVEEAPETALIIFSGGASGCLASGCVLSGCLGSACTGSGCGGSACAGSACGGSGCGGSACGGSGCAGSGCAGSACTGSGCVGSLCVGSACPHCSSALDGDDVPVASAGAIVGLNIERTAAGNVISWIATGAELDRFRLYRDEGYRWMRLHSGKAAGDRRVDVADPGGEPGSRYRLEISDGYSRQMWAETGEGAGRSQGQVCPKS